MVNFKKVMMASAGGESYWAAGFSYYDQSIKAGAVKQFDGQVLAAGNFQDRNYIASLNAGSGDLDFTFATKGRYRFSGAEADLGYAPPQSALYDPVHDVYAINGFYTGSTTGTNISGNTVQTVIYDRNVSTSASQLNRTWGKNYQTGGATADSFVFDSAGDLITGGYSRFGGGDVSFAILYDQSDTGYGAAYTPSKSIYLKNANAAFTCRHCFVYLNSSEELIMVGNHHKSNGYLQYGVAKISGSSWNTLDVNKAYTFGNGSDTVQSVSYNETLDHVAILHWLDVSSSYAAVTLVDCSDGSVTNCFTIDNPVTGTALGRVIALDSQWNIYVGWQNLSSDEAPLMKINNANTTSRSMEWLLGFDNTVGGSTLLEYVHINENDVPIISFSGKYSSGSIHTAGYVMKMPADGSAGSSSGSLYNNTNVYDRTSSSSVSFTTKNPSKPAGNITLNSNFPDNLGFSNSGGIDELEDWEGTSYKTSI